MKKVEFHVLGMRCVGCSMGIQKLLKRSKGVSDVEVMLSDSRIFVTYDESIINNQKITETVARLGYQAVPQEDSVAN